MGRCLGIDIGYGFTKTFNGVENKTFATVVTAKVPSLSFAELSPVIVNGEKFLVGEEAEREAAGRLETRSSGFVMSNAWLAILGRALSTNNFKPGEDVLVLGIPPGQYSKPEATKIAGSIENSSIIDSLTGSSYLFHNTIIKVIPQGSGIFFSYLNENPQDMDKNIAVLDIGHHTLDMVYFSKSKYIESATESRSLGVAIVLDSIIKEFYRQHKFNIHYADARKLLANNVATIQETDYSMENIKDIVSPYVQQVATIIDNFFEKLPGVDLGIAGGGGVLALKNDIKLKRKLRVVSQPEMANAIGYLLFGSKYIRES